MSIYLGSRYETAAVAVITDSNANQNRVAFRGRSPLPIVTRFGHWLVSKGDRLDRIAEQIYGRPDYWWAIADANDGLSLADPLSPGTVLRIPDGRDLR